MDCVVPTHVENAEAQDTNTNTLHWHNDQGLFLAFSLNVECVCENNRCFVHTSSGTSEEVQFDNDVGLVIAR